MSMGKKSPLDRQTHPSRRFFGGVRNKLFQSLWLLLIDPKSSFDRMTFFAETGAWCMQARFPPAPRETLHHDQDNPREPLPDPHHYLHLRGSLSGSRKHPCSQFFAKLPVARSAGHSAELRFFCSPGPCRKCRRDWRLGVHWQPPFRTSIRVSRRSWRNSLWLRSH